MVLQELSEDWLNEIEADDRHAQLLIQLSPSSGTIEEATTMIRDFGIHVIEAKALSSRWTLIKLDAEDMREIVLKLTERGFLNIKGINASRCKI